jgi:hypothetical protein
VGTTCQSLEGSGGSWTRSVADIIRKLLAFTGMSALALFALACCLTLAGAVALYRSRDRVRVRLTYPATAAAKASKLST